MEYRNSKQQLLLSKLLAYALELKRVPTFDEVKNNPNMPDPNNDYGVEFGGFSKAVDEIRHKLACLLDDDEEEVEKPEEKVEKAEEAEDNAVAQSEPEDETAEDNPDEQYEGDPFDDGPLYEGEIAKPEKKPDSTDQDSPSGETKSTADEAADADDEEDGTKVYRPLLSGPIVKLLNYTRNKLKLSNPKTGSGLIDDSGYVAVAHEAESLLNYRAPIGGVVYTSFQVFEAVNKPMILYANNEVKAENLIEFPAPKDGVLLIVEPEVIQAAKDYGRDTDDLIYVKEHEDNDDGTITATLFARL